MDKAKSMGIPAVLGSPTTIFPRTFRFLFIPKKNPDLQYLVTKISIDFYQKSMDAQIMEIAPTLDSQDWIINMGEDRDYIDDYTLIALDGCGNMIYTLSFQDVKAIWHNVEYDYAKSEVVTHHVGFEYEKMERIKGEIKSPKPVDTAVIEESLKKRLSEAVAKAKGKKKIN